MLYEVITDILHCYGLMLAAAAPLLNARSWVLWLAAAASVAGAVVLQLVSGDVLVLNPGREGSGSTTFSYNFV